jgi:hypothetical protein
MPDVLQCGYTCVGSVGVFFFYVIEIWMSHIVGWGVGRDIRMVS